MHTWSTKPALRLITTAHREWLVAMAVTAKGTGWVAGGVSGSGEMAEQGGCSDADCCMRTSAVYACHHTAPHHAPKKPSFHFLLIHLKGKESAGVEGVGNSMSA